MFLYAFVQKSIASWNHTLDFGVPTKAYIMLVKFGFLNTHRLCFFSVYTMHSKTITFMHNNYVIIDNNVSIHQWLHDNCRICYLFQGYNNEQLKLVG